ncbi:MAG: oligosaccharide flippase family protein, partial [Acetobacteraceae bacterium]|nr:oligosaccharide flippase family protein [Acetobacteraceae bacterium]
SANITLAMLLRMMLARVQDVIIGGFLTAAAVGAYRIGWRMLDLITQVTAVPVMVVSVVTLSRLQDDRTAFTNAYGRMLGLAAMMTIPAIVGFGVLSDDLIYALFGSQWTESGRLAKILAFMAVPYTFSFSVQPTLAAAGRAKASIEISLAQFVATVLVSLIAVPFGLQAVAVAFVVRAYAFMPYQMFVLRRDAGIGGHVIAVNMLPPLWAALFMVACILAVQAVSHQHVASPSVNGAIGVIAGAIAYGAGLLLFGRGFVLSQLKVIRPLLTSGKPELRAAE